MKIITYNVNGLRSALSKGFTDWLATEQPDVVCLQETKAQPDQIPTLEFEALGYKSYFFSAQKKGYSGVGILTRIVPDHVEYGMGISKYDNEGRFIRADYGDISIASVYHPSGTTGDERQAFKMEWLEDFRQYVNALRQKREKLIICGDYNICHRPIDIHDPGTECHQQWFLTGRTRMDEPFSERRLYRHIPFFPSGRTSSLHLVEFQGQCQGKQQRLAYRLLHDNPSRNTTIKRCLYPAPGETLRPLSGGSHHRRPGKKLTAPQQF